MPNRPLIYRKPVEKPAIVAHTVNGLVVIRHYPGCIHAINVAPVSLKEWLQELAVDRAIG
jgi:hypothetical protein